MSKTNKEVIQALHKEFAVEVDVLSAAALKARIVVMQQELAESEAKREELSEPGCPIYDAKETLSLLTGPFNDVKKAVKLKTKYLIDLIAEKGG